MNELRLKLEEYEHQLQILKAQESYIAEKYNCLLKPWPIKCDPTPFPPPQEEEDPPQSSGMLEVEEMLRKARIVRSKTSASKVSQKGREKEKGKSRENEKGKLKNAPNTHKQGRAKTAPVSKPSKLEAEKKVSKPVKSESFLPKPQHRYKYLDFEEVLENQKPPSKIRKLREMHRKIMEEETIKNLFQERPCEAEMNFISKLSGIDAGETPLFTSRAVNNKLEDCIAVCERLVTVFTPSEPSPATIDAKFVYKQKSLISRAKVLVDQLDDMLSFLNKVEIIDEQQTDKNLPTMELQPDNSSQQFYVYRDKNEVEKYVSARHEHRWLESQMALLDILQNRVFPILETTHKDDISPLLPLAYGILAKPNRCCVNPSLVVDDGET
nr:uncharacterized protein LOC100183308 [Ciona intestinalis]|eukprot:XP_018671750.1 uncharacterized protein LOC100183308 [Ciona intestinalis]